MASAATLKMPTMDADPTLVLLDDPFFLAMESGKIQWGDLMAMDAAAITTELTKKDERVVEWWLDEYKTAERLEGWEVPDLTLRSDIEEHFPVVLQSLPASEDGRERFVVTFDADRVDAWAAAHAESHDEYSEYAEWVQTRLIFALRQYSHKYRLESEGGDDHVAIFGMSHPSAARRARAAIPTLRGFPVSWDRDPVDHTRHLIKLHQKRVSEERYDLDTLAYDMVDALLECKDCTFAPVVEPGSPYVMVVTIPTAEPPAVVHVARPAAPAPRPVHVAPAAPAPAPRPAMGGAGGPPTQRALDVMRANRLAWDRDRRDGRIHRIKHRSRDQEPRILAELSRCGDCTVESTPRDPEYMCVLTLH